VYKAQDRKDSSFGAKFFKGNKELNIYMCIIRMVFLFLFMAFSLRLGFAENVFEDALQRKVVINVEPKRIVAFAPSITELLFFLEVQDRVVGVTEYSDYPPEAKLKPKIGSYININMEKVLSLRPDLVIVTKDGNPPHVVESLEQAKIPVYVINPRTLDEIIETLKKLSKLLGASERVEKKITELTDRIERVTSKIKWHIPPKVFLQINTRPVMTVGRYTLHNDIIRRAGGINIFYDSETPYPRISVEEVVKRSPDVIFISSMERSGEFHEAKKEWEKWKGVPAVKNNHIFMLNSDLIDRATPRAVDALERINLILSEVAGVR
jgi:iron complex transport system substrate-binding protein